MSNTELTLRILQILVPAILSFVSLIFSLLSLKRSKLSEKLSRESNYKANRPKLILSSLTLYPDRVKTYIGKNVKWNAEPIVGEGYDYKNIVLNTDNTRKDTFIHHNGKDYMFINLCHNDSSLDKVVLAFDILNIELNFDNARINEMKIEKAYSMTGTKESFGEDIKIDLTYPVHKSSLEIPVAYACLNNQPSSMLLFNINELAKSGEKTPIDFLESRSEAGKYIGFVETAYLLQCKTVDDEVYYYSMFLQVINETLAIPIIHNGSDLFEEKATEASKNAKKNVIQNSINKAI